MRHVFILACALVLIPALTAVQAAATPPQEQYYPVGRFAVAAPQHDVQYHTSIVEDTGSAMIRHDFVMTDASGEFQVMVLYMSLDQEPSSEAVDAMFEDVFTDMAQASLDNGSATLLSKERTQWEGLPALEFTLQMHAPSGENWLMARVLVAGNRFYVLRASAPRSETCDRVMQSFWVAP